MEIIDLLNPEEPTFEEEYRRCAESESAYDAAKGRMMLDFLDALRKEATGPRLLASRILAELWLQYSNGRGHSCMILAKIDHKDRAPLVDGIPPLHYRLSYTQQGSNAPNPSITPELRTRDLRNAVDFVWHAIRECRRRRA